MPGTVSYLNHEPVWILFGATPTNLGLLGEGDVTVSFNREWVPQKSHQTGNYDLEAYDKGGSPTIEITTIEVNNWDNWLVAFGTGEKQTDGASPPATRFVPNKLATTTPFIGAKASSIAHQLVLVPQANYVDTTTETARDLTFPLAWCMNVDTIPFGIDTPNAISMTFGVLFNPSATDGENLWIRGLMTPTGAWAAV